MILQLNSTSYQQILMQIEKQIEYTKKQENITVW